MSRLVLTAVGGDPVENTRLDPDPELTPGPDDLVVALEAAPINPADFLLAAGRYAIQPSPPHPLGAEGVGRVVAAGAAADPALVGRRVLILPTYEQGTWAGRAVVPARNVVPVGDDADPRQLAMLPINPATAYLALHRYVDLKPGDWIGLTMANSAVGQYVIALARHTGVKVLAVVRREDAAKRVRDLGADAVLVDGEGLGARAAAALGGAQLRLLLDGVGGAYASELVPLMEKYGTLVAYSAITGEPPAIPVGDFIYREIAVRGFFVINWVREAPREEVEQTYGELADLVARGVLRAEVEATYPLDRYREAFTHAQRWGRDGKVLFTF